jgi:hypothetical protein
MTSAKQKPLAWSTVRAQLSTWDKPTLIALVKDLYSASDVGHDLVNARCQPGQSSGELLER